MENNVSDKNIKMTDCVTSSTPMGCSEPQFPSAGRLGYIEQLMQLMVATPDGNIINKSHRDVLVRKGYATRSEGFNVVSSYGLETLRNLGFIAP